MNWIEILRLIVQIWPLIEKILKMISNSDERDAATNGVQAVVTKFVSGQTSANTADEVIAALVAPLPIA